MTLASEQTRFNSLDYGAGSGVFRHGGTALRVLSYTSVFSRSRESSRPVPAKDPLLWAWHGVNARQRNAPDPSFRQAPLYSLGSRRQPASAAARAYPGAPQSHVPGLCSRPSRASFSADRTREAGLILRLAQHSRKRAAQQHLCRRRREHKAILRGQVPDSYQS